MQHQVSNRDCKGEGLPSQDSTKSHARIVDKSLLARLAEGKAPLDKISVQVLGLSARGYNALKNAKVNTIQQLIDRTESDLLRIPNIGVTTLDDIKNKLNYYLSSPTPIDQYVQTAPIAPQKQREELELATTTISGAFQHLLQRLTQREVRILKLRYGLEDGQRQTLEEVGREFEVSRERVRQIQEKALRKLRHPSRKKYLQVISSVLENIVRAAGGILPEVEIGNRLTEATSSDNFHPVGLSRFVLQLSSEFVEIGDEVWALAEYPLKYIPTVVENAVILLEAHRTRMRFNALVSEIKHVSSIAEALPVLDSLFIEACIKAAPEVELNLDGWCGLTKWRSRYLDEMVQVLRDEGKPLHYTVVSKRISDSVSNKRGSDHNVHALLQREETIFVRVDPGTYGLREWGHKPAPYYLTLIEDTFRKAGKPLAPKEVIRCVSEVRPCKESTVLMYLTLNERFVRLESGEFALREWLPAEQQTDAEPASQLTTSFVEQLKKEAMAELWPFQNSIDSEE